MEPFDIPNQEQTQSSPYLEIPLTVSSSTSSPSTGPSTSHKLCIEDRASTLLQQPASSIIRNDNNTSPQNPTRSKTSTDASSMIFNKNNRHISASGFLSPNVKSSTKVLNLRWPNQNVGSSSNLPNRSSKEGVSSSTINKSTDTNLSNKKKPYFRPINTVTKGRNTKFVDKFDYYRRNPNGSQLTEVYSPAMIPTVNENSFYARFKATITAGTYSQLKNPEKEKEFQDFYFQTFLNYWYYIMFLTLCLFIFFILFIVLSYYGYVSQMFMQAYDYQNTFNLFMVVAMKSFMVLILGIYLGFLGYHTDNRKVLSYLYCCIFIASMVLLCEEFFTKRSGPNIYLISLYGLVYISPLPAPRSIISSLIWTSFLEIPVAVVRYYRRVNPPNFSTGCLVYPELANGYEPSCAENIIATQLLYLAAHTCGTVCVFFVYRHARKLFFKRRELEEELKKYNEIAEEASRVAMSLLPRKVWEDMRGTRKGPYAISSVVKEGKLLYKYENVTILFGDVVGFTQLSSVVSAQRLVRLLDAIFTEFDELVETIGLEKIKTIGDAYMICAGVPEPVKDGEMKMIRMGKEMIKVIDRISEQNGLRLQMRIGLHKGSAWGGVQGTERLIFDVWSRDVSIAALMEQTGMPSKIHVSETVYKAVQNENIQWKDGPEISYKDEICKTYFVDDSNRSIMESDLVLPLVPNPMTKTSLEKISALGRSLLGLDRKKDSTETVGKSNVDIARQFVEAELRNTLSSNMERRPELSFWSNKFLDESLEEEYQSQYVQRLPLHSYLSVVASFVISLLFIPIAFMENSNVRSLPYLNIIGSTILLSICFIMSRGFGKRDDIENFGDSDSRLKTVEPLMKESEVTFIHRNIQIIAPAIIILMCAIETAHLLHANSLSWTFYILKIIIVKFQCVTFPRIAYLNYASVITVITLLEYILFLVIYKGDFRYLIGGYIMAMGDVALTAMIIAFCRHTECNLRADFVNDREWVRQRYKTSEIIAKTSDLLNKLVPLDVVQRLKDNPKCVIADFIEEGAILFAEIKIPDSKDQESELEDIQLVNILFTAFDKILNFHHVEKIKSVGNIYIVMAYGDLEKDSLGLGRGNEELRASYYTRIANFALGLRQIISTVSESRGIPINFHMGINVGNVVAGVIGKKKIAYDVWGDTVNVASRMNSSSPERQIQITEACARLLEKDYDLEERGVVVIKGKGEMRTHFLLNKKTHR